MLLKTAVGLIQPDSGHISLFGEEVTGRKESQLYELRSKVGILFQEGGLFDSLTIAENVAYPLLNQFTETTLGARILPALSILFICIGGLLRSHRRGKAVTQK